MAFFACRLPAFLRAALVLLPALAWSPSAEALKFVARQNPEGQPVLIAYDCGNLGEKEGECSEYESSFTGEFTDDDGRVVYPGDARYLDRILNEHSYYQVLLYSNGGDLQEGLRVGEVLRRHRQYVRVAAGMRCVSSCTVAFLGGVIRDVDPDASYEMHAYSRYKSPPAEFFAKRFGGADGEFAFDKDVSSTATSARTNARDLLLYVQGMIGGRPDGGAVSTILASAPDFHETYRASAQSKADLARIRAEGGTAAQEILMRIERESFESLLQALKAGSAGLGARGDRAVQILEIMFTSRIAGTAELDQNTLREYGYINVHR